MKTTLVVVVCLVLVAVITAENAKQRPTKKPLRRCRNGDDCEKDECCVGVMFLKGSCRKLAQEGQKCNGDVTEAKGKYMKRCPCADGLKCVPEKVVETLAAAENAKQMPTKRPTKRCHDGDDCEADECCVGVVNFNGSCRKLAGEGERCNGDVVGIKGKYVLRCPCVEGLKCVAEEVIETENDIIRINERCTTGVAHYPEPGVTTDEQGSRVTVEEQTSRRPKGRKFHSSSGGR